MDYVKGGSDGRTGKETTSFPVQTLETGIGNNGLTNREYARQRR